MPELDLDLPQLNLLPELRANSSFMKIIAALYYHANKQMTAHDLVDVIKELDLLPLRGNTPQGTLQGIISTSRTKARQLGAPDPFTIEKTQGRQALYSISKEVLNDAELPSPPDPSSPPPKPVRTSSAKTNGHAIVTPAASSSSSSQRKKAKAKTKVSTQTEEKDGRGANGKGAVKAAKKGGKKTRTETEDTEAIESDKENGGEQEDTDTEMMTPLSTTATTDEEETTRTKCITHEIFTNQDPSICIVTPSIAPTPTTCIDTKAYSIASHFAIAQQTGYSYPRFRSADRVKIPKEKCEDKFCVADLRRPRRETTGYRGPGYRYNHHYHHRSTTAPQADASEMITFGRLFCLADGHGGPGCAQFFVERVPREVEDLCRRYDPGGLGDRATQRRMERELKELVRRLDDEYLERKRAQFAVQPTDRVDRADAERGSTSLSPSPSPSVAASFSSSPLSSPAPSSPASIQQDHLAFVPVDDDGCTLMLSIFLGDAWLVQANVGDSRTILMSAPDIPNHNHIQTHKLGYYKLDVDFASQDHKPYLEHLAREILENGGEFVDAVQNRVIKVDPRTLREDGNRQRTRVALKNARIRPRRVINGIQGGVAIGQAAAAAAATFASMSAHQRRKATASSEKGVGVGMPQGHGSGEGGPSLNVARSCGDLAFKLDSTRRIISCEPDVTFVRIGMKGRDEEEREEELRRESDGMSAGSDDDEVLVVRAGMDDEDMETEVARGRVHVAENGLPSETARNQAPEVGTVELPRGRRRRFLLMSSDGLFDHLYEDHAEKQNKAVAKAVGKHIEEAEKALERWGSGVPEEEEEEEERLEEEEEEEDDDVVMGEDGEEGESEKERERRERRDRKRKRDKERALGYVVKYLCDREGDHNFFSSVFQEYDDCTVVLVEV